MFLCQSSEWDEFEQDGHSFARSSSDPEEWTCKNCGATKDTNNYTRLPDDSWAELEVNGRKWTQVRGDFETCAEACALIVMEG